MKVELTAQETLHIDMPVVISGLSGAFLWVSIFAFWTSSCRLLQKRRLLVKTIGHPQSLHIASEVLQFPHWRKRHKSFNGRVGWTWCLLWALLWRAANKLHDRYVVGTLCTTWLTLKYIFHSFFLSLHGALWMVGSLLRWFTGKIDQLPGRQQVGDISNTFRAVLRGYPPGLRSWTIPIPKQHSGDTTLAATGLLCGVTAGMCVTQRTQQHVRSKTRSTVRVGVLCHGPRCDNPATAWRGPAYTDMPCCHIKYGYTSIFY